MFQKPYSTRVDRKTFYQLRRQGIQDVKNGLYQNALEKFQIAKIYYQDDMIHYFCGIAQYYLRKYEDSEWSYKQALMYGKKDENTYTNLSVTLIKMQKYSAAYTYINRALQSSDASSKIYGKKLYIKGYLQNKFEQYINAKSTLNKAKKYYFKKHLFIQIQKANKEQNNQRLIQLNQYLSNHPNDIQTLIQLSDLQIITGDIQKAKHHARLAINLQKNNYKAHQVLGRALIKSKRYQQAIKYLELSISLNIKNQNKDIDKAQTSLSFAYNSIGRYQNGVQQAQNAIYQNNSNYQAYNNLGYSLFKLKFIQDSIVQYEESYKLNPWNYNVCRNLALSYKLLGNKQQEKRYMRKYQIMNPQLQKDKYLQFQIELNL